ncbi:MAG: lysophospholipid acyltransferase family protein [Spirochaetales bacterium]
MVYFSLVYWLAFWLFLSVCMAGFIPIHILKLLGFPEEASRYLGRYGRFVTRCILKGTGARLYVEGLENVPVGKPYCYISNHQANADVLLLMATVPEATGFIAKVELRNLPLVRNWMHHMGCYFLKRDSLKDGLKAILYGAAEVKKGHPMIIFPEGTRSQGPVMLPFRRGGVKLATKAKALAVPVSVHGTFRVFEQKGYFRPAWIGIRFHPPLDTARLRGADEDAFADQVRSTIEQGVSHLRSLEIPR